MKKLFIIIALMLIYSISANAQYLWVVGNNSNGYPIIKSEVKLFDKDSAQELRDPVIANWTVVENGKLRKINKITCPDATGKFSIILVIDRSMSMSSFKIGNDFRIEVAKKTAIKWVTKLFNEYLGNFECSLMQFSTGTRGVEPWVKLLVPFTETNKDTLLKCINLIKTTGGTDFNAAFLWDCDHNPGAMLVAKQAKYLPIVVFITDGAHAPNECKDVWNPSDFRSDMVIEYAHKNKPNVIIYSLFMDNPSVPIPDDLTTLASGTNGKTYQGFTTEDQITDALNDILDEAGKNPIYPPCVIEWETACDGGAATFTNLPTSATYTLNYTVDPKLKPYLEINPRDYLFLNQGTGDKTFTITARNNYVDLTGFTSDPRFSIVDPPQLPPRLEKGQSLTITIRYTSTDSNLAVSNFMLTGSACDSNWINASAGFRFCRIIDMGFNKLTDPEKCDTKVAFCNYTNKDVIISSPRIEGGANPDEFRVKDVQGGYLVKAGECKIIEFCFSPKVTGRRSSFFRTEVDGVLYEAEIFGEGGGKPAIEGLPITMPNVDCSNPSYDSLVVIKNTGADILTIDGLSFVPPNVGFGFKGGNPVPPNISIDPNKTDTVFITFNPASAGLKNAVLRVHCNAANAVSGEYDISLQGTRDSVGFITSVNTIDFGIICPNKDTIISFDLTNTGTVHDKYIATINSPFKVNNMGAGYEVDAGNVQKVEILINSKNEGVFNEQLKIIDDICGTEKIITITANVIMPKVTGAPVIVSETVGSSKTITLTLNNTSGRDLDITSADPDFTQFKITKPSLPIHIGAKGQVVLTIVYSPDKEQTLDGWLVIKGEPCGFIDSVQLTGTPTLAKALIFPQSVNSLIGDIAQVPIKIDKKNKFMESGVKTINTNIIVDAAKLTLQTPYPPGTTITSNTITLTGLPVQSNNNIETVTTLNFLVLENANPCADMQIYGTKSFGGTVVFTDSSGEVCVIMASADISVKQYQGSSGDVIDVGVYLLNPVNVQDFHQGISAQLKFNATLLEPIMTTASGDVVSENGKWWRIVDITDLPVKAGSDNLLKTYKFRAMLGDANETDILIQNSKAKKGMIEFNSETAGKFTLLGVCNNNNVERLFNPFGSPAALLMVKPNPTSGLTSVSFQLAEDGSTRLLLFNTFGGKSIEIRNEDMKAGSYSAEFDAADLSSGVYILVLQTPTQTFSRSINIVK